MRTLTESLLLPPGGMLILFALGMLIGLRWKSPGRSLQILAVLTLYALSTPYLGNRLLASLERSPPLDMGRAHDAGAIVVLSANASGVTPEYGSDTIGAMTLERMRYAARLQRETGLPLLVTGGVPSQYARPLATMMAEAYESDFGITPRWVEDRSLTTAENAEFSAAMLKQDGISTIILVTHGWHMPRAILSFAASGLTVIPAPTMFTIVTKSPRSFLPRLGALDNSYYALHEYLGLLWYRLSYHFAARP